MAVVGIEPIKILATNVVVIIIIPRDTNLLTALLWQWLRYMHVYKYYRIRTKIPKQKVIINQQMNKHFVKWLGNIWF